MKVLKFGGTSVANAENISKVIDILLTASKKQNIAVVVSALGGVTDDLLHAGELATNRDQKYIDIFESIKERHVITAQKLISTTEVIDVISAIETKLEELKNILQGIYLINEFSDKSKDKLLSFGEFIVDFQTVPSYTNTGSITCTSLLLKVEPSLVNVAVPVG